MVWRAVRLSCDERIQKIQTIKMMEGILVCAAPQCLKSFLKKAEFESHIHETHAELLPHNAEIDGNELEASSAKQSTASAPSRPVFSPNLSSHVHDSEDSARYPQPRKQQPPWSIIQPKLPPAPYFGQVQNHPSEPQSDNNSAQSFERPGPQNHFPQQSFDTQGGQGILSETPFLDYSPMHGHQPPIFAVPVNSNPVLASPPFSYPPFPPEGSHPFYGAPYEMMRPDSAPEVGSEQGSLLGFPPGPVVGMNFEGFPQPWNVGAAGVPFESTAQGLVDGFANMSDPQGRHLFFQDGDKGQNVGVLPSNIPPPSINKVMEPVQGRNAMDPRDGKGILAPPPFPFSPLPPPPPPPPPHISQHKQDRFYS